ncbi:MAG: hypothetical protein OXU30_03260, partial [Gammaproteobacteria bacterium]|nr:hypothetical protein [Gammaproteobacteria bacterium]
MESFGLIASLALLFAALAAVTVLAYQLQRAKVKEVAATERLAAKQDELDSLQTSASELSVENKSLKSDIQAYREELATIKTSLELERKQFEEKLDLLNESREQLSTAFKNIANEIFEDKSKKFTATNKESLSAVLTP